ncbi:Beige/BEACH domain containing protein [Striga asiatica]|uniref:Beige/BEACH domain containing protein n=1 Tax=Striga asiatica TaxID=4170 RepID=A0A5A7R2V7_STRAF|nr:Beige/BEACH domain containing protein [Striga asiatica]
MGFPRSLLRWIARQTTNSKSLIKICNAKLETLGQQGGERDWDAWVDCKVVVREAHRQEESYWKQKLGADEGQCKTREESLEEVGFFEKFKSEEPTFEEKMLDAQPKHVLRHRPGARSLLGTRVAACWPRGLLHESRTSITSHTRKSSRPVILIDPLLGQASLRPTACRSWSKLCVTRMHCRCRRAACATYVALASSVLLAYGCCRSWALWCSCANVVEVVQLSGLFMLGHAAIA